MALALPAFCSVLPLGDAAMSSVSPAAGLPRSVRLQPLNTSGWPAV